MQHCQYLKAVVLDWAGTTIDHGSRAPVIVFTEIFQQRGIKITAAEAREPMGIPKRDHIAAIASMPEISQQWLSTYGRLCTEEDIDAMYREFVPLQQETLKNHSEVIAGIPAAVERCREMGLKIASTTGYNRELMDTVAASAREQGFNPDCIVCADDVSQGRPAPYLLFEAARQLEVYPMWKVVCVDDTPVGIEAGRNAGCWTVGVTRTGNCVGLSEEELNSLSPAEQHRLTDEADRTLREAGAHDTIGSVAELPALIEKIEQRAAKGEKPI